MQQETDSNIFIFIFTDSEFTNNPAMHAGVMRHQVWGHLWPGCEPLSSRHRLQVGSFWRGSPVQHVRMLEEEGCKEGPWVHVPVLSWAVQWISCYFGWLPTWTPTWESQRAFLGRSRSDQSARETMAGTWWVSEPRMLGGEPHFRSHSCNAERHQEAGPGIRN